jgi:hypothetical protein
VDVWNQPHEEPRLDRTVHLGPRLDGYRHPDMPECLGPYAVWTIFSLKASQAKLVTVLIPEVIGKNLVDCGLIMPGGSTDLLAVSTEPGSLWKCLFPVAKILCTASQM